MKKIFFFLLLSCLALSSLAQIDQTKLIQTSTLFGDYTIHYNVFNSTNIPPKVAEAYGLVRGKDRALINISLTKTVDGVATLGLPAKVTGVTRNLMQQKQPLKIIEIAEGEATYYLAPFVFTNEEVLHFDIQVQEDKNSAPMNITFSRTLYTDK